MADELVVRALEALGIERLVLAVHDLSFPAEADEDTGRGTPYSRGAAAFLTHVRSLGFDGIQLGPQGQTSLGNPSPYDGSVFSKNILSIALAELSQEGYAGLLPAEVLAGIVAAAPPDDRHTHHRYALPAHQRALRVASDALRERAARGDVAARAVQARVDAFAASSPWLSHDTFFEAFALEHGTDDWRRWPAGERTRPTDVERRRQVEERHRDALDAYVLGQLVLHEQHLALRGHATALGLRLYGDLQVGLSLRDSWSRDHLFLPRWRMGAPPSRTNPEGQPWGYRLLDARSWARARGHMHATDELSPPLAFFGARVRKMFAEFDGLRIDHPHGIVCPWVYDGDSSDPMAAVRAGARLFETPRSEAHPELEALSLVDEGQVDRSRAPFDDAWVRELTPAQVDAYAVLMDLLMKEALAYGRSARDVLCEVLSTCPRPLHEVMKRYDLGRFRVTQKSSLTDAADGYRSANARPRDWIMVGNHDTEPLLRVLDRWERQGATGARAAYLAERLEPDPLGRARLAGALASDRRKMVAAMFAELFASPARNVLVFFSDWMGERAVYNEPGLVSEDNWRLRVPRAYARVHAERARAGEALDLPSALAIAVRARGADFVRDHAGLLARLEERATVRLRP